MLDRRRDMLRSSEEIMELTRMGATWPTKFSFSHSFLRHVSRIGFECRVAELSLDDEGRGRIVYRATVGGETLTFAVFSDPLDEAEQQDRIIATRWDAWAALFIGIPSQEALEQSRIEVQNVVWGRAAPGTITWSRANRSARLFEHVIERLAAGRQPDAQQLNQVGYLIRTTGFSGNGRNGMHDYTYLRAIDHPLKAPYHAQMLAAYLWREFGFDLALHLARARNPAAVDLSGDIRRFVGVGNSSGIGLVPFVIRHPRLMHSWIEVRERALAEILAEPFPSSAPQSAKFAGLIADACDYFTYEPGGEVDEFTAGETIAAELKAAMAEFAGILKMPGHDPNPIATLLYGLDGRISAETQELLHALALEIHDGGAVDADSLHADESLPFPRDLTAGEILDLIRQRFAWVSRFTEQGERPYFWYASEENMEPRRGCRGIDEGELYELPVDILGRFEELMQALKSVSPAETLGRFLVRFPDMRFMTGWAYTLADTEYAIARMDLLAFDFSPLKIMRFQLALYGMLKFRPRSKTWLRATLFQGAGLPQELAAGNPGDGLLPRLPEQRRLQKEDVIGE